MKTRSFAATLLGAALLAGLPLEAEEAPPDFSQVFRILDERCVECHSADDFEGGLVLETFEHLMKGGETGAAIVPGKSAESLTIKYLRGEVEKDGKRQFMPPGKREKFSAEEIQLIARWIDAGARPPVAGADKPREIHVPRITPKVPPRTPVNALAFAPEQKLIAVGRFGIVELLDAASRAVVHKLEGHKGNVNALAFSPDGSQLFAASGENGLQGEVKQWNTAEGKLVRTLAGHRDTIYALALSPNGRTLATGSYDQQIKLWNVESGAEIKTLRGHNGAVFSVAFRPDGKILASASADRTVKLWDAETGQRRDTLSQPTKEQTTLAWGADGRRLAAAGFDNRIRVWEVSGEAKETTNPLLHARFAHEGPVLKIAWSADGKTLISSSQDGTVKLWDAAEVRERLLIEKQPDWPSAIAFLGEHVLIAGRLDGSLACYDAVTGAALAAADKKSTAKPLPPTITALEPRGIQRGTEARIRLSGKHLAAVTGVKFADERITGELLPERTGADASILVKSPADLPRNGYDFTLSNDARQASAAIKLFIGDLPHIYEQPDAPVQLPKTPASVWGVLEKPGETDRVEFDAQPGQTLVFDLACKAVGSKSDSVLSLLDGSGRVLASNHDFDGTGDPLVAHRFTEAGRYAVAISDAQFAGSKDHFYQISIGELPLVTACFPLSVPAHRETEIELIGFNLPSASTLKLQAGAPGEMPVPLDPEKVRARRAFKVLVSEIPHFVEAEPNDLPAQATPLQLPASAGGRLAVMSVGAASLSPSVGNLAPELLPKAGAARDDQRRVPQAPEVSPLAPRIPSPLAVARNRPGVDVDLYRFEAKKGTVLAIETAAQQRGSPADTRIEVLHADGKPVERLLLQAVRDSAITFRPIDSASADVRVDNWQEMELNELMYLSGEVAKIFRMPEGPDSGFQFYTIAGKRAAYFNTTPTAHALDEPCYIVEPHPPGAKLISNGLPVFPLHYANDDDGERKLGTDSRLLFTAPADASYLVRVSDSRGLSGERFVYRLVVRDAAPDFAVRIEPANLTLNAGSGQGFTVAADRKDGFDGPITVQIAGVPSGYKVSTPLVIESGHQAARGTIFALPETQPLGETGWNEVKVTAHAGIAGQDVTREVNNFGKVTLGAAPKVFVALESAAPGDTLERLSPATPLQTQNPAEPFEITIAPGEIIPAWIKVKRNGHTAELRFDVENLPHGVIVDNLGLNGITLLEGQNEGEIALKAAAWVSETDRLCYAITREAGKQTSLPVLLHVRKKEAIKPLVGKQ